MMTNQTYKHTRVAGFTLIEALIALAVFSFGLLAIAKFQTALISSSAQSKARSEAVQLAQQKLDQIRKYSTEPQLVANILNKTKVNTDKFSTSLPNTTTPFLPLVATNYAPSADAALEGNNATFARNWDVICVSDSCSVVVNVTWADTLGASQTASIESRIAFKNPKGGADLDVNTFTPLVPSATGRAYLGSGTVTQAQLDDGTANNDGTVEVTAVNGGQDRVLVDASAANDDGSYNIILTLDDACSSTDGVTTCTDFVRISGKVYRDNVGAPINTLTDIYVLASDAAYCARDLSDTVTTTNGNYSYYPYTCYLGGGWHGNIGVTLTSAANNTGRDHVCLGDPNSPPETPVALDDGDGLNNWHAVEAASRRVYRGVTYIGDVNTVVDTSTLFYSQGIGDAVVLPDSGDFVSGVMVPGTDFRNYTHDYVLTKITGTPVAIDCLPALTRPDSDTDGDGADVGGELGDIFYRVSTDFVCLNVDNNVGGSDYLDTLKLGHMDPEGCRHDPSRGPALAHYVEGIISVPSPDVLDGTAILNSTNPLNCNFVDNFTARIPLTDITGLRTVNYSCIVYDWGSGWTGKVYLKEGFGLFCDPAITLTAVAADVSGQNFTCETKLQPNISGTIKAYMNDLTGTTIEAVRDNADSTTSPPIQCTPLAGSGDTIGFNCVVEEEVLNGGWTGTVTLTPAAGITCDTTSWSWPGLAPTLTTLTYNTGTTYCYGPAGINPSLTLSGNITSDFAMTGLVLPTVTATGETGTGCGAVTLSTTNPLLATYDCLVSFSYLTGWTGTVTVDTASSPALTCAPLTHTPGTVTTNYTIPTNTACFVDQSGQVTIEGRIYDLVTPTTTGDVYIDRRDIDGDGMLDSWGVLRDSFGTVAGTCVFNYSSAIFLDGDMNNYGYRCTTSAALNPGDKWTGSMEVFPLAPNIMCTASFSFTRLRPSSVTTQDFAVSPDTATCTTNGYPVVP